MNMNKPPDETLKQGRNRSWVLVKRCSTAQSSNISIIFPLISSYICYFTRTLTEFNLERNTIGDEGAEYIANGLQENQVISYYF